MSHTQAELKRMIAAEEEKLKEILYGYKKDDEYKGIDMQLSELKKQITLLERRKAEIAVEHKEEYVDEIELAKSDLKYSRDLLYKIRMGLDYKDYSDELQKMFRTFCSGFDGHSNTKLEWVSDGGGFALFKRNSYSSYGGRFSGSSSIQAVWALVKIVEKFDRQELAYFSPHIGDRNKDFLIWTCEGGRWNKKKKKEMDEALFKHVNGIED